MKRLRRTGTLFKMFRTLVFLALIISGISEKQLKLYNTKCSFSQKYVANGTCSLKLIARNEVVFNSDFDLVLPLKNVTFHIRVLKFYNQYRPFVINDWVNLCNMIRNKGIFNFFVKAYVSNLSRFSNAIICHHPVIKINFSFHINNMRFSR